LNIGDEFFAKRTISGHARLAAFGHERESGNEMLYRFEEFVLDSGRFVLLAAEDKPVALQPRALELLLLLVRNAGAMVSKETIRKEVWGGLHVSRSAIPLQVNALRKALGDEAKPYRFIETVHGRGLRWLAPVSVKNTPAPPSEEAAPLAKPEEREGVASELVGTQPTIAVLPFAQDENAARNGQLGQSLAVDILVALSQHRMLRVTSRASSFLLDGATTSPLMAKSALGVDYCLSGSISAVSDQYALFVELTDTTDQRLLWSAQFEVGLHEVQSAREGVVGAVVSQIERQVPRHETRSIRFHQPESLTAWQAFHFGETLVSRRGEENFLRARRYFERAVSIDPGFARAWSGLAHTYAFEVIHRAANQARWAQHELMKLSEKAIKADPDDPSANMMMGRAIALGETAEPSEPWFLNALDLAPSYAEAHHQIGLALAFDGPPQRALDHSSASILLSPQGSERYGGYANLAVISFRIGDMDNVVKHGRKAAQVPFDDGYSLLAGMCAHHVAGESDIAHQVAGRFRRAFPSLTQRELFGLYDLGPEMESSISEIYSTYGIN
ncbi:MAG: winged helix-turn-helix domain-containing protein, partial [Pseudomonadota bacterium]